MQSVRLPAGASRALRRPLVDCAHGAEGVGVRPPRVTVSGACLAVMAGPDHLPLSATHAADTPWQTVGSADTPGQTVGSADAPRQTVGSAHTPQQSAGLSFHSDLAATFAATLMGSRRPTLGPAAPAPPPPLTGGPDTRPPPPRSATTRLLVEVASGWRLAGDQAASRALRLASPHSARYVTHPAVPPH